MNPFWKRFGGYLLQRLGEPTTWVGIVGAATGLGIKLAPQAWDSITSIGLFIASGLMMAAREGRNKPDNPSMPSVVMGSMPAPKAAIVTPAPVADLPTVAIDPEHVAIDSSGGLHAEATGETKP